MADILNQILQTKRQELDSLKEQLPIDRLIRQLDTLTPTRDFVSALTVPQPRGISVIAEIKKASPSASLIRPDFDPVAIASIYADAQADAISVLTDTPYFQGSLEYLTRVRQTVETPLLRKDFIIDPYQLYQARVAGADAVLLIAEAFQSFDLLADLFTLAADLKLAVLFEIHDAESTSIVDQLIRLPSSRQPRWLLGINNRNLKTMTVDINHSIQIAKKYHGQIALVSESGIKSRQHVETLIDNHFNAVLIGETLMRQPDIAAAFNSLFNPS